MDHLQPQTITQLLLDWRNGEPAALDELLPLVYGEIHKRAKARMKRERPGHMLQATALITEVFLRLRDARQVDWESRNDFFKACSRLMFEILKDIHRTEKAIKRGGNFDFIPLDEALLVRQDQIEDFSIEDLLALDEALKKLGELKPRHRQVVELRALHGCSIEETAVTLGVATKTVKNDWRLARAWLLRELRQGETYDT